MRTIVGCAVSYLTLALGVIWFLGAVTGLGVAMRPFLYTFIPITICGFLAALLIGPIFRAGLIEGTWRRVLIFNILGLSLIIAFYVWALGHFDGI